MCWCPGNDESTPGASAVLRRPPENVALRSVRKHPRRGETVTVRFNKNAIYDHFHTLDDYEEGDEKFTMDFHHIWEGFEQALGDPECNWTLTGERYALEARLKSMLPSYYIDNLVIRFVNDNLARYE